MIKNTRWNEFINIIESRRENIICIGAGKNLKKWRRKLFQRIFSIRL